MSLQNSQFYGANFSYLLHRFDYFVALPPSSACIPSALPLRTKRCETARLRTMKRRLRLRRSCSRP